MRRKRTSPSLFYIGLNPIHMNMNPTAEPKDSIWFLDWDFSSRTEEAEKKESSDIIYVLQATGIWLFLFSCSFPVQRFHLTREPRSLAAEWQLRFALLISHNPSSSRQLHSQLDWFFGPWLQLQLIFPTSAYEDPSDVRYTRLCGQQRACGSYGISCDFSNTAPSLRNHE